MPDARSCKAILGFQMQDRRMRVLAAAVGETHSDVRLEGALVRGEAGVAINPEQRAPRRTWVSHEKGAELGEMGREAADEQQRGFEDASWYHALSLATPFVVVVPPKLPQELEQLRVEGGAVRLWPSQNRPQIRAPHSWRTPESLGPLQRHSNRRPSSIQRTRGPIPASLNARAMTSRDSVKCAQPTYCSGIASNE